MTGIKCFSIGGALAVLVACGGSDHPVAADPGPAAASAPIKKDARPAIVIFGDSLSAGFGLEAGQSYPDYLQKLIDAKGYSFRIVNLGLSGDTTTGGLSRLDECLTAALAEGNRVRGGVVGGRGVACRLRDAGRVHHRPRC